MSSNEFASDAYDALAFNFKEKVKLRDGLNIGDFVANKEVMFELEDVGTELTLEDDDDIGLDSYTPQLAVEGAFAKLKNANTLKALLDNEDFIASTFSEMEEKMTAIDSEGLVLKEMVQRGNGQKVLNGKVFYHYVAVCEGYDEPCDSSVLRKAPAILDMRKYDVIPGLYLAICSMEVNEVSKFIIRSKMAYGKVGIPPRIPPEADVLFIVEVLQIVDEEALTSPLYMTTAERADVPFKDVYSLCYDLRTEGNGHFSDGNYPFAVQKYRKAATMLQDYPVVLSKDDCDRSKLLHTLFTNLAECYLQQGKPAQACTACKLGIRFANGKQNVKLLFRFARAKLQLKDCDGARKLCDQALKLEPLNQGLLNLKAEIKTEESKQDASAKKLYQAMLK